MIMSYLAMLIFILVGVWVVWKIFKKILHIAVFVIACLILFYIFKDVPLVHSTIMNLL